MKPTKKARTWRVTYHHGTGVLEAYAHAVAALGRAPAAVTCYTVDAETLRAVTPAPVIECAGLLRGEVLVC